MVDPTPKVVAPAPKAVAPVSKMVAREELVSAMEIKAAKDNFKINSMKKSLNGILFLVLVWRIESL